MTSTTFIKLLTDTEHDIARRRNSALARGRWLVALECDAQEKLCGELRNRVATEEAKPPPQGIIAP